MNKQKIGLVWTVLFLLVTEQTFSLAPVKHGATYVFTSVADDLTLTANRHLFRKQGIRAGPVTLERFDGGNPSQLFDAIIVRDDAVSEPLVWLTSHHNSLSALSISPNSEFPVKNFLSLLPVSGENVKNQILIRSSLVNNKCVQGQGRNNPVIYAECDFNNKYQRFKPEFLFELDKDTSNFISAPPQKQFSSSYYF